jgi:acid phosphatase family membrane protein YuiD
MEIAATVLSILVALLYLVAASTKLAGQARQVEIAQQLGIAFARYRLIGIPELAASVGLIVGLWVPAIGAAAAIGLALVMVGATVVRARAGRPAAELVADVALLALNVATAVVIILAA